MSASSSASCLMAAATIASSSGDSGASFRMSLPTRRQSSRSALSRSRFQTFCWSTLSVRADPGVLASPARCVPPGHEVREADALRLDGGLHGRVAAAVHASTRDLVVEERRRACGAHDEVAGEMRRPWAEESWPKIDHGPLQGHERPALFGSLGRPFRVYGGRRPLRSSAGRA